SQSSGSQIKYEDINQIDEDDIEEMDIKWNMALLSMRADRYWKNTGKKISIQGTDVAGFDKLKVECFNCHKIGHFARECRAPRSQDRGWDWSYMANEKEDHALVADQEAPTEFALMAKSSSDTEVFDNSLCSKACKKNTDSLNTKFTDLSEKLSDSKTMLYHYKLGLSQVEARLVEFKNQEINFCEKIRGLEFKVESKTNRIKSLTNELEMLNKEKEGLDSKHLDDTITDYTRPLPKIESNSKDLQNNSSSVSKKGESISDILSKPEIKFVKATYSPIVIKTNKDETGNSQNIIDDKGYWDSGCSRHMTGNISYLLDYEPYNGGYVPFGQGGCKITDKGTIKTECIVLGRDFKLRDDTNVLLRNPRQHNLYSIDLNNIVPHKDLTCLVAKASADESELSHKRLGKQHKASCKTKVVNLMTKPLYTLHMDLFGPTSTKDETSGILRNFITEIENLKDLKVKIIRCDNGGEFRNKEMNDFCSMKGIKREFSNAKTPQQNEVAKKRSRTLIEAARTIVLVNKSQNNTPYELFNVVSAGTTSTNFSGTKEAASQDVKKDVSSLRYIALPNWFHEAHLESSASNAQDACKANAPESSGNSNPTATLTNPSTDQTKTPTVETPTPTVSSPVLTACLDVSLQLSSDIRLISKRVTGQVDTQSLDNILTLSNRFEDILRVTTNTGDSHGVEANLGNMENNISASPTPTFRIHKDHPTSQIIGHVDTPAQTRTKSKEMEKQSFIASIHHMTNPDLLQFCLFSCFLSQEEPKKISDALNDPSWLEAIPIGTKWVLKNKKDERGIIIRNKAKLVAQGHTQEEGINYEEVFAPVARIGAIRLFLAYASFMGFIVYQMDVKSAFLYGTIDEEVYVMQPPGFQDPEFPARVYKVEKAMNGLYHAPRAWYVKRIFRYLKGDPKQEVWYPKDSPFDLVAYSDSDYGGATQDRKSTTGGCQFLGRRLISWQCKKQTIVATSKTKAEYVAAASGKYEHNANFHQIVDFVEASHLRYALTINPNVYVSYIRQFWSTARVETSDEETKILATVDDQKFSFQKGQFSHQWKYQIHTIMKCLSPKNTGFNEFSSNIATALVCQATNRVYNFSKMIFDGMVWNVNNKVSKFLMYLRVNSPSFLGRTVPLFESMLVTMGEGSGSPTEPHHTPSPEAQQTSPTATLSPLLPPVTTATIPTVIPTNTSQLRQYTKRAKIDQSSALLPIADEPASPIGDDSQGEACFTDSGLEAEQDMENITKTSTLPSDSTPRVTSFVADEGSMQHKLTELTDLYTRLQRQHDEMASKITAQDLEISALKAKIKHMEDKDRGDDDPSGEDATIKGRRLETGEEAGIKRSTKKGSNDTEEMVNVLTSLDAVSVLSSGVQVSVPPAAEVATVSIPPTGEIPTVSVPTGSGVFPTASPIFTTATVATPYSRRKGKEKMEEDAKIARIHVEEELQIIIDGLDRNNETVSKYLQEYHQFAVDLSIRERIELISDLVKYQDNYAKVLKYLSQQRKPLSKKQQREFYMSVLRSHARWKTKHFKGMSLEEIREKFVPVWKHIRILSLWVLRKREKYLREKGEDLNQLWALVKETLNIGQATSNKKKEL
nr:hypothetical protein [Tanacetum cinerariifolium]